jgi:hypothetical protein
MLNCSCGLLRFLLGHREKRPSSIPSSLCVHKVGNTIRLCLRYEKIGFCLTEVEGKKKIFNYLLFNIFTNASQLTI